MPKTLDQIIYDLHWMARRYADGRSSYAPGSLNDNVRTLLEMGYELKRPFFARDGMGRQFDGLSEQDVQDAEDDMPMGMMQVVTEAEERAAALRSKVIEEAIEALKKAYAIGDPYPIPSSPWNKGRNELYERALNALTALKDKAELRSICHADTEQAEQSVSAVPASSNEDGEAR